MKFIGAVLLANLLIFSDLGAQFATCSGFTILPFEGTYCSGDALVLNYELAPDSELPEVLFYSDYFQEFGLLDQPLILEPNHFECANGLLPVFVEVFCPITGDFEFFQMDFEYLEGVHPNMFLYDNFNCRLELAQDCGYEYEATIDGNAVNFDNGVIDLFGFSGVGGPFDISIEMFNPLAVGYCATSTLTYTVYDECLLQPEPCADYTISPSFSQSEICTGDILSLEFEGDISQIDWVGISTYFGTPLIFEDLGFNGSTFEWQVSSEFYDCSTGTQATVIEVYCSNGGYQLLQYNFEYLNSLSGIDLWQFFYYDELFCEAGFDNPCDYSIETNSPYLIDHLDDYLSDYFFFDTQGELVEIVFTVENEFIPSGSSCDSQTEFSIELECVDCDYEISFDQSAVCPGDVVLLEITAPDELAFLSLFMPDGKFFDVTFLEQPVQIEWLVGNVGSCDGTYEIFVDSPCVGNQGGDFLGIDIYPSSFDPLQATDLVIQDCVVCVNTFCPDDQFEWIVDGVLDPNTTGVCYSIQDFTDVPTNIEVRLKKEGAPDECSVTTFVGTEVPCSGCIPLINELPNKYSYCLGEPLNLIAGPIGNNEYSYEWFLDGELVDESANYISDYNVNACTEEHDLRAVVYCQMTGNIVYDQDIALTLYDDLTVSTVVNDCYVEVTPDCPDITVFWTEGTQTVDSIVPT